MAFGRRKKNNIEEVSTVEDLVETQVDTSSIWSDEELEEMQAIWGEYCEDELEQCLDDACASYEDTFSEDLKQSLHFSVGFDTTTGAEVYFDELPLSSMRVVHNRHVESLAVKTKELDELIRLVDAEHSLIKHREFEYAQSLMARLSDMRVDIDEFLNVCEQRGIFAELAK